MSLSAMYALIEAGKIACHRLGMGKGSIRISQEDLQFYLESCRVGESIKETETPRRKKLRHISLQ